MDRIFREGAEYQAVGIITYSEEHFVQHVLSLAPKAYPGWHLVRFDPLVDCNGVLRRPDLALIADDLSCWYVVEAELSVHPFEGHILPQVRDLSRGNYLAVECAEQLISALPHVPPEQITSLIKHTSPKILVISFGSAPGWRATLKGVPAELHEMRIFRSDTDDHLVLIDGPALVRPDDISVPLSRVSGLASLLKVSPTPVIQLGSSLSLEWNDELIVCEVVTINQERYIQADGFRHIDGTEFMLVYNPKTPHHQLKSRQERG